MVVASRKLDSCEVAAAEISESTGRRAVAIAAHVGHWNDCDDLMAAVLDHFGRLDVLVSNAGMSPVYDSLDTVTEELYDKTQAVNLKGPFRLGVLAGTYMAAHDGGSIINIGTAGLAHGERRTSSRTRAPRQVSTCSRSGSPKPSRRRCASTRYCRARSAPTRARGGPPTTSTPRSSRSAESADASEVARSPSTWRRRRRSFTTGRRSSASTVASPGKVWESPAADAQEGAAALTERRAPVWTGAMTSSPATPGGRSMRRSQPVDLECHTVV